MTSGIVKDTIGQRITGVRIASGKTLREVAVEVLTREFSKSHHFAEMIERRLLVLKDVRHHAFLTAQEDIVDMLLLLHD